MLELFRHRVLSSVTDQGLSRSNRETEGDVLKLDDTPCQSKCADVVPYCLSVRQHSQGLCALYDPSLSCEYRSIGSSDQI